MKYIEPKKDLQTFTCPHCKTLSTHIWEKFIYKEDICLSLPDRSGNRGIANIPQLFFSRCSACYQKTVWINDDMVYPNLSAPEPNSEMPQSVLDVYKEAGQIYTLSARGACALLRLAIQILCKELGEKGKNINDDIASLVRKDLPVTIQEALDVVRVIGNNAVHPGQIDADDQQTAIQLFELVNIIVEYMIAMPKKTSGLFANLPSGTKDAIKERDGK